MALFKGKAGIYLVALGLLLVALFAVIAYFYQQFYLSAQYPNTPKGKQGPGNGRPEGI
jgi:hypothetical protein